MFVYIACKAEQISANLLFQEEAFDYIRFIGIALDFQHLLPKNFVSNQRPVV